MLTKFGRLNPVPGKLTHALFFVLAEFLVNKLWLLDKLHDSDLDKANEFSHCHDFKCAKFNMYYSWSTCTICLNELNNEFYP